MPPTVEGGRIRGQWPRSCGLASRLRALTWRFSKGSQANPEDPVGGRTALGMPLGDPVENFVGVLSGGLEFYRMDDCRLSSKNTELV